MANVLRLKRWVAGFDSHGDMADPDTMAAFLAFVKSWKAHKRIAGGDHFDFRNLRRRASQQEKAASMQEDVTAGMYFLNEYRPHVWTRGNHDERLWWAAVRDDGLIKDYAQKGVTDIERRMHRCEMLPYHKRKGVYSLGDTVFVHGYYHGKYAASRHAATYGKCFFGHVHANTSNAHPHYLGAKVAVSVGALVQVDMDYNEQHADTMRHDNGWAYGVWNPRTGSVLGWLAQKIDGVWVLPSEVTEVQA